MSRELPAPIAYPPMERHAVIGDRRTAALVAADGTLDWLCLPDYDGDIVLGAVLDRDHGGYIRLGPLQPTFGKQAYAPGAPVVTTSWAFGVGRLELTDAMVHPAADAAQAATPRRTLVRRLVCTSGRLDTVIEACAGVNFKLARPWSAGSREIVFPAGKQQLRLWFSRELEAEDNTASARFPLSAGEEVWLVASIGDDEPWTVERARKALEDTGRYWSRWQEGMSYSGRRADEVRRSGMLVHLLSYAASGSVVAAPTTSLPERIGADWNADYRFGWVRDASLSMEALTRLGKTEDCKRYLEWLEGLGSSTDAPLQPMYGIRGETVLRPRELDGVYGYRGSKPVRVMNHAYRQQQLDGFGYLADCALTYLEDGGEWEEPFWDVICRSADYVAGHWQQAGNSIWELPKQQHYLSAKVMSWVALDRSIRIGQRQRHTGPLSEWARQRDRIHADVLEHGWSSRLNSFKQRYEGDNLDAAALLVSLFGFLPPDDPRVRSTVERISELLAIDGFVFRFVPKETPEMSDLPMGEFEGAFLPCTFWLATAFAQQNRRSEAEAILAAAESIAGPSGVFAEGVDVRNRTFLGNMPLLFSHVEYVRAVMALDQAKA